MKKLSLTAVLILLASGAFAETITFNSDSMSGTAGSKTDTTTLRGNAFVKTSTMEIKADSIELSGDNFRYITAEGNVSGINSESNMDFTCGKMKYDRDTKIAQLEDSVHLIDNANNVTADAQLIEYNQNSEIAVMQINVSLKQKDNVCTSAYAIYRKNDQMLEMSGNPKIIQGEDTFRAQEISLNLDTQEITLDGRVRGTVTDTKKSSEKKEQPSAEDDSLLQTELNTPETELEVQQEEDSDQSSTENELPVEDKEDKDE